MTLESVTLPLQEHVSVIINPVCISASLGANGQKILSDFFPAHIKTFNQVIFIFGATVCATSERQNETNDNCVIIKSRG